MPGWGDVGTKLGTGAAVTPDGICPPLNSVLICFQDFIKYV